VPDGPQVAVGTPRTCRRATEPHGGEVRLGSEARAGDGPARTQRNPPAADAADDLVSGRYRLHERLGSGGMGVVWRATDELLDRQVAIKRIRLDLRTNETVELSRQRTLREARIAAQLHHPHIVTIFDVLTVDGDPWLVLEHLLSETLSKAIRTHGPPGPRVAAGIGVAVADGLAAAHRAGIVHRDVKPANVLLGRDGMVKLTDFGISHSTGDLTLTAAGLITGTPAYLAPETAEGRESTSASDIYSLGATLYAAVEGVPPIQTDGNVFRLLQRVAAGDVPPPQHAGALEPVLRRMMSRDPQQRPDAVEARELLRGVLNGHCVGAVVVEGARVDPPAADGPAASTRTARAAALVAAVLLLALLALLALVVMLG